MAIDNDQDEVPTASLLVWIALTLVACTSFWNQAAITEERFVPALSVIADKFNIPDDVAGATLMAAGASSPELFSSFVALFITHSSLGLGTIVGSEIFNQLVICAGAVFASKSGKLELDRAIIIREVGFYVLGICLLYMALQDTRFDNPDDPEEKHIYIHFWQACAVFGAYILYVLVCANMDAIVAWFSDKRGLAALTSGSIVAAPTNYGTMEEDENINKRPLKSKHVKMEGLKDMPFLREHSQRSKEPPGNFQSVKFYRTLTGEKSEEHAMSDDLNKSNLSERSLLNTSQTSLLERSIRSIRSRAYSDGNSLRKIDFILQYEKPSDEHDLHDIDVDTVGIRFDKFFGFLFLELS